MLLSSLANVHSTLNCMVAGSDPVPMCGKLINDFGLFVLVVRVLDFGAAGLGVNKQKSYDHFVYVDRVLDIYLPLQLPIKMATDSSLEGKPMTYWHPFQGR